MSFVGGPPASILKDIPFSEQQMIAQETPVCDFGWPAPDFRLPDPAGKLWTLEDCRGSRATLVMFLSNHCPFVKASLRRIIGDLQVLAVEGVAAVGIMSNDIIRYPEDGPEEMQRLAAEMAFPFPYLVDESQQTASEYGATWLPRSTLEISGKHAVPQGVGNKVSSSATPNVPSNRNGALTSPGGTSISNENGSPVARRTMRKNPPLEPLIVSRS